MTDRVRGPMGLDRSVVCRLLATLVVAILVAVGGAAAAPPAGETVGRAVFVRSPVRAEAAGLRREIRMRNDIFLADELESGTAASARFVMRDRTMLALHANTRIAISEYRFNEDEPAADGMVTTVLDGSLRALTGLLDKRNPDAVTLKTEISTIGVRGTAVRIDVFADGHNEVTFEFGHGWVENKAGRVELEEGFSARIADATTLPALFRKPPDPDDPAELARKLAAMMPQEAFDEAKLLAGRLGEDEQILLLGMMGQVGGAPSQLLLGVLGGLIAGNTDLAPELIQTEVRLRQDLSPSVLRAAAAAGVPAQVALEEVLRSMDTPSQRDVELALAEAIDSGITRDGADAIVQRLRAEGVCP